jgi:hypothetical protein
MSGKGKGSSHVKIGAENKTRVIALAVLLAIALAVALYNFKALLWGGSASAAPSVPASVTPQPAKQAGGAVAQPDTTNPNLLLDVLENSRKIKYQEGRNIFSMEALPPPTVIASVRGPTTPTPPPGPTPTPPPPPIPLKYYGFANKPGEPKKIFLQEPGGEVFVASQGDIVARRYRVFQIQANSVTMEDVITGNRQPVQLTVR